MAGAFGYQAETIDVSLKMAELSLLPAVRKADADAIIVADGTSAAIRSKTAQPPRAPRRRRPRQEHGSGQNLSVLLGTAQRISADCDHIALRSSHGAGVF
jgi:hypothetical protein